MVTLKVDAVGTGIIAALVVFVVLWQVSADMRSRLCAIHSSFLMQRGLPAVQGCASLCMISRRPLAEIPFKGLVACTSHAPHVGTQLVQCTKHHCKCAQSLKLSLSCPVNVIYALPP